MVPIESRSWRSAIVTFLERAYHPELLRAGGPAQSDHGQAHELEHQEQSDEHAADRRPRERGAADQEQEEADREQDLREREQGLAHDEEEDREQDRSEDDPDAGPDEDGLVPRDEHCADDQVD